MKKAIPFLLLLAFAACKKNAGSSPPPAPTVNDTRIASWQVTGSISENYTYDSKNRITSAAYNGYDQNTIYTYTDSTVKEQYIKTSTGAPIYTNIYKLNNKGLAVSQADTSATDYLWSYEYTSSGYLARSTQTQLSTGYVWNDYRYYYTNDVNDSIILYRNNAWTLAYYYQYYTDKINSLDNLNFGLTFLGRKDRLPVKMAVRWSPTYTDTTRYSYTFDAKQNISQQSTLSAGNPVPEIVNYTYR